MKLELDVWHYLLNVYTMFENDISKHVEKKPGKLRKIQDAQKKSPKFRKYDFCKKYTTGHLRTKFEVFTLLYKATIAKIEFDLHLAVN